MVRVRRIIRRSLVVAGLGICFATALAGPDVPAVMAPVEARASDVPTQAGVADPAVDVVTVGHADVLRLYWAFFSRDPDPAGARYWLDRHDAGATIEQIAHSFSVSDEFRLTYGATSNSEFVRIVYANVLGRAPDDAGFAYWTGILSDTSAKRANVVRWVSASTEFISAHPYRPDPVARAVAGDAAVRAAVDVVESIAAGRPTRFLPDDRSTGLVAAIDSLRKRFGRHSSVEPIGACRRSGGSAICELDITEVGMTRRLELVVENGLVTAMSGVVGQGPDEWAVDAVRTAVAGNEVLGVRTLTPTERGVVSSAARRIAPTVGTVAGAQVDPRPSCTNGVLSPATPGADSTIRRVCAFGVSGPLLDVTVEAVAHGGVFAGLHTNVPLQYSEQPYAPYATVGPVTLHHPADRVERIGFHQSGHDGARQQDPADTDTLRMILDSRGRGTGSRTAADIVVHPEAEIRAPVSGVVKRAGTYTLYCRYSDHYLVIEPDARPGYEVKVLHFEGLSVENGDRVTAGVTVVGSRARQLPFESQVDAFTADPSNGHIHVEVVDPSIPDRPSGRGC